jgi:DNA helicase HerA-like ATPase
MFIEQKVTSTYLGKEIKRIKPGDVFVIDIAMIPTLEEQRFVVGDVMKSIDELYSARQSGKRPRYILIFIDEVNRFIPRSGGKMSAVAEQVMRTVIAGTSRGTILFSAQQFKSEVDSALHEGTGMHIMAKLGMSELSMSPYSMIDESTKANIVRLNKGELVMVHPAFRHPIKIVFPKAPFRSG